jgi:hypothetical protein
MARELRFKLGIPVSYEDAPWTYREDLQPVGSFPHPNSRRVSNPDMLVPAMAAIQLSFLVDDRTRTPLEPAASIIKSAVEEHERRRNPGEFRAVSLGAEEGFSIVPSRARDRGGQARLVTSPLDVRITFPEKEGNFPEILQTILDAVGAATGAKFIVFDQLKTDRIRLGANGEVARDVLVRALRESYDWKVYWNLYYGPEDEVWAFNFGAVYRETGQKTPAGAPYIEPVRWPGRPYVLR